MGIAINVRTDATVPATYRRALTKATCHGKEQDDACPAVVDDTFKAGDAYLYFGEEPGQTRQAREGFVKWLAGKQFFAPQASLLADDMKEEGVTSQQADELAGQAAAALKPSRDPNDKTSGLTSVAYAYLYRQEFDKSRKTLAAVGREVCAYHPRENGKRSERVEYDLCSNVNIAYQSVIWKLVESLISRNLYDRARDTIKGLGFHAVGKTEMYLELATQMIARKEPPERAKAILRLGFQSLKGVKGEVDRSQLKDFLEMRMKQADGK